MKKKTAIRIAAVFLLFLLVAVNMLAVCKGQPSSSLMSMGETKDFSNGWYTVDSNGIASFVNLNNLSFYRADNNMISIYHTMTDSEGMQETLVFSTEGLSYDIYINDVRVSDTDAAAYTASAKKDPGFGWHFEELPATSKKDILRMDLYSAVRDGSDSIRKIYIGSSAVIFKELVKRNIFRMVLCLVLSLIGIFYVFIHFTFNSLLKVRLNMLYIGIFIFFYGLYSSIHLTIPVLFASNVEILNGCEYVMLMLLPVFLLIYISDVCEVKNRLLIWSSTGLLIVNAIAQVLINAFTGRSFHSMLFITHIIAFYAGWVIIYVTEGNRHNYEIGDSAGKFKKNLLFYAMLLFALSLAADVLNLYFTNTEDATRFSRIGLLLIAAAVIVINGIEASEFTKRTAVSDMLRQMAYTDQLTGLSNRSSFEKKLDALDAEKHGHETVAVIMFDVNNLKKVNDNHGHQEGDKLIRSAADAISDVFLGDFSSYRIGGDEFACIYSGKESMSYIEHQIETFHRRVDNANLTEPEHLKLSIAVGVAYMSSSNKESISGVFRRADRIMYENKRQMKSEA